MASTKSVPAGTLQNTCVRRKRAGQPHREHGGPFLDNTGVSIMNANPLTGWRVGVVLYAHARPRNREWQAPMKYRVQILGPGPKEERTIRGSLLVRVALDG